MGQAFDVVFRKFDQSASRPKQRNDDRDERYSHRKCAVRDVEEDSFNHHRSPLRIT